MEEIKNREDNLQSSDKSNWIFFTQIIGQLEGIKGQLQAVNVRLDGFEKRLDSFEKRLDRIEGDVADLGRRVAGLEHKWAYLTGGVALLAVLWTVAQFMMGNFDITVQPRM